MYKMYICVIYNGVLLILIKLFFNIMENDNFIIYDKGVYGIN
ncbi:hypothetical protein CHRY9293_02044 [Chryseobacterium potabilaquae]|uniref:Uncharacterized protein n=1 Tax=Chryseobacterium potabilaquae TaxID=2675057 RepID=A0A6N4X959_9FLAO|nr:hypothetical protein CHRY9293_02044 [Chryseobacterium potabilaquae]